MRKKIKLVIIAMILSLLSFKQVAYCSENLIEKNKNTVVYCSIDPSELAGKPPKVNYFEKVNEKLFTF